MTTPVPSSAPNAGPTTGNPVPRRRLRWWVVALALLGVVALGGLLARVSPLLVVLAVLLAIGTGVYVLVRGAAPALRLQSRASSGVALGAALLLMVGGAGAGATTRPPGETTPVGIAAVPSSTATTPSRPTPTPTVAEIDVPSPVPFERTTVEDGDLDAGTVTITTAGVDGVKVTTFRVTTIDGKEVSREAIRETITVPPVTEITTRGTRAPAAAPVPFAAPGAGSSPECHPSYADACVPFAEDVDCAGGEGDGPAYVQRPVRVVGPDVYKLDHDKDGIACD
ncbi:MULTISPECIES: G5 domain-containing protein [Bacteria]|uniref:G5 domain-containing protein n=1 Tax=Bacteria TaxID=2 RepID=UPI003C7BCBD6